MAVATTNAFSGPFTANGSTTIFPFTFTVLSGDDVAVALRDADGVETTVSANDYAVALTGDAPSAGSVTFDVAPVAGYTVWLYLDPAFTQETEFADGHPFIAGAVNNVNDRAALRDQVLRRDVDRALLAPIGESGVALPPEDQRAGKYMAFDGAGAVVMSSGTGADAGLRTDLAASAGSDLIGFLQSGTGAATRTVQDKLRETVSVDDFGAVGDGMADDTAAFSLAAAAASTVRVPAGTYLLNTSPSAATWIVDAGATFTGAGRLNTLTGHVVSNVGAFRSIESDSSFYSGIFGYLEQNAALSGYGTIGVHGAARSIGGSGVGNEADIGVAGFAVHDLAASNGGVWALYGTAVRQSGVGGATHPLELDIANMGTEVPLFPHQMFSSGATPCAWICTGGEVTAAGGAAGVASCAIGIVQNDSQVTKTASFEKGIIFHNASIKGADGTGSIGSAIAFASGHAMQWFNNSGTIVAEIVGTAVTAAANNYRLDFSAFGLLVQDRGTGAVAFQVEKVASAANGLSIRPNTAGNPGALVASGSDADIDLRLLPKGTGVLRFGTFTSNADAAITGYITVKDEATGTLRKLATIA